MKTARTSPINKHYLVGWCGLHPFTAVPARNFFVAPVRSTYSSGYGSRENVQEKVWI